MLDEEEIIICPKCKSTMPSFNLQSEDDGWVSAKGHICWNCQIITDYFGYIVKIEYADNHQEGNKGD